MLFAEIDGIFVVADAVILAGNHQIALHIDHAASALSAFYNGKAAGKIGGGPPR